MLVPATIALCASQNGDATFEFTNIAVDGLAISNVASARMQVRKVPGAAGDPYLDVNSDGETEAGSMIDISEIASGNITVTIRRADWSVFPVPRDTTHPAAYCYDLCLTFEDGTADPYIKGPFYFDEGVTKL